jgi:hypothetical protein
MSTHSSSSKRTADVVKIDTTADIHGDFTGIAVTADGKVYRVLAGTATELTVAADTSASATKLATARAIYGNNFDGTAALAQVIASTYGGTGNGFAKFSGPATAEKTFTLPNSDATLLYSGGALGTPITGTLTNCTGLPLAGVVVTPGVVSGSKASGAALTSLLGALVTLGLITDSTEA